MSLTLRRAAPNNVMLILWMVAFLPMVSLNAQAQHTPSMDAQAAPASAAVSAPGSAAEAAAATPGKIDTGDTAWMIVSTALVMLMTPGLALFYGGMVRRKNVLATVMQSFIALGVVTVQWCIIGYTLAFGGDAGGLIGDLKYIFLRGVGQDPLPGATIPHLVFMLFQMMFAIITPALITGAIAERFKFKTYLIFLILWSTLVYDPLAH